MSEVQAAYVANVLAQAVVHYFIRALESVANEIHQHSGILSYN